MVFVKMFLAFAFLLQDDVIINMYENNSLKIYIGRSKSHESKVYLENRTTNRWIL